MSIQAMVAKGQPKYAAKVATMKNAYTAAAGRASANFAQAGFGPTLTANYQRAMSSYAVQNYNPTGEWATKWATNFAAKASQ